MNIFNPPPGTTGKKMKKTTKYYLYAGYYEFWISTKELCAPLTLMSWHRSIQAAERRAEKEDDLANIIYDSDIYGDTGILCDYPFFNLEEMRQNGEIIDMSNYALNASLRTSLTTQQKNRWKQESTNAY